jgi:hypothetical protein
MFYPFTGKVMDSLKDTSPERLEKYNSIYDFLIEKHADNLEDALKEIVQLEEDGLSFFNEKIEEQLELSKSIAYRDDLVLDNMLREKTENHVDKDIGMLLAAYYTAKRIPYLAKKQHLENLLHDSKIIFNDWRQKINLKIAFHAKATSNGSTGGNAFVEKSRDAVFITLDTWRKDYSHLSNKKASRELFPIANAKIKELNDIKSAAHKTNLMLPLESQDTIAFWISNLKRLIENKSLHKKCRACILDYYKDYYCNNIYFRS